VDGELRVAGSTYGPWEFWPGPIPESGLPNDCLAYDRLYTVYERDIHPDITPGAVVREWPVELGAPFWEIDDIPGYTPLTGDRPRMRGHQYIWWVDNDLGNLHDHSDSNPLGVEVINEAFAFDAIGDVGNMTFYRHTIINKSDSPIEEMYVGRFADVDLGDPWDDAIGSDSTLSLAYVYTLYESDGEYGTPPPAFGFAMLEVAISSDGVRRSLVPDGGQFFSSVTGPRKSGLHGDPRSREEKYNFLRGLWSDDGSPMRASGRGYEGVGPRTKFIFHGDPVSGVGWSELNLDGNGTREGGYDKRVMGSYGPVLLNPGDSLSIAMAYIWVRGSNHLDSVTRLKAATRQLHEVKGALLAERRPPGPEFIDGNPPETPRHPFWVDEPYPNPASDRLTLRASFDKSGPVHIRVVDALGRTRLSRTVVAAEAGQRDIPIEVSSLAPGTYSVSVESWSHRTAHTFVVLR